MVALILKGSAFVNFRLARRILHVQMAWLQGGAFSIDVLALALCIQPSAF